MPSGGWGGLFGGGPWGGSGGVPGVEFVAHVISSTELRLKFEARVEDDGNPTDITNYILDSFEPFGTYYLPNILSVKFDDPGNRAIIITFEKSLTLNKTYRIQALNLKTAIGGLDISGLPHSFLSTVPDPPRALTSHISGLDTIDIVFDRSVGPTSSSATASIRPSGSTGPGTLLTLVPYVASIPEDHIRFTLNPLMVSANSHEIVFSDVVDESLNVGTNEVDLNLKLRAPSPFGYSEITQAQIIGATVNRVNNDYLVGTYLLVYFNVPMLPSDITNSANWSISTPGSNVIPDTSNTLLLNPLVDPLVNVANEFKTNFNSHIIKTGIHVTKEFTKNLTFADLVDESNLITLSNDLKRKYEAHRTQSGVHPFVLTRYNDLSNIITSTDAYDVASSIILLNEIKTKYNLHRVNTLFHIVADTTNIVTAANAVDITTAAALAEQIKNKLNYHRTQSGVHTSDDTINVVTAVDAALFITSPTAIDTQTSIDICNEAQNKYLAHLSKSGFHVFEDTINTYIPLVVNPGNVPLARAIFDQYLYTNFNIHITDSYQVTITNIRNENFVPYDPFYDVAEVRVDVFDTNTPFNIEVTANNLNSSSITNPANYSGSIGIDSARSISNQFTSNLISKNEFNIRFDKKTLAMNIDQFVLTDPSMLTTPILSIQQRSSVPNAFFMLDHLADVYEIHRNAVIHYTPDVTNIITTLDRPYLPDLQIIINSSNLIKDIINEHFQSSSHFSPDQNLITAPNATDLDSLIVLLSDMETKYLEHIKNHIAHNGESLVYYSTGLFDSISVAFPDLVDDEEYTLNFDATTSVVDNAENTKFESNLVTSASFFGVTQPPAIASALSEIGIKPTYEEGKYLTPDSVLGFISKPLRQKELTSSNIQIPSVIIKNFTWISNRRIATFITNMQNSTYNFTITGITDKAGNDIL
jgi:hypothetical protein